MNLRFLEKFGVIMFTLLTSIIVTFISLILAIVINFLIQRPITYKTFILATTVPFIVSLPFVYIQIRLAENLRLSKKELEVALREIKTLRGIIPICMHCKQIRDDKGFWSKVEEYVEDNTHAQFSHGICPECTKKYYPDIIAKRGKEE